MNTCPTCKKEKCERDGTQVCVCSNHQCWKYPTPTKKSEWEEIDDLSSIILGSLMVAGVTPEQYQQIEHTIRSAAPRYLALARQEGRVEQAKLDRTALKGKFKDRMVILSESQECLSHVAPTSPKEGEGK